jgi:hypothetical protein
VEQEYWPEQLKSNIVVVPVIIYTCLRMRVGLNTSKGKAVVISSPEVLEQLLSSLHDCDPIVVSPY